MPAMLAAVAASTAAAGALLAARGGAPGRVAVDAAHVAVAARSERYAARVGAAPAVNLFAPLSKFWPTSDGWVRLHTNYPWHLARALQVLRCRDDPDEVGAALARRPAIEWEDAFAAAGALAFAIRTPTAWGSHPQGRLVAAQPLIGWLPGSDVGRHPPGRDQAPPRLPASGLRVVDLTRVIAGPVATRTLAGWGATVLRIDSPGLPEIPAQTLDTLQGKHSALLDLAQGDALQQLHRLLDDADLLVHGYRPGALDRFGLGTGDLFARHPGLAVVGLSAWSTDGPWGGRRGFDSLVQGPTGISVLEGAEGADGSVTPGALPAQVLDHATGYLAAAAALTALAQVAAGGPAPHARLSLARTARWLQSVGPSAAEYSAVRTSEPDPEQYLITLDAPDGPLRVIRPPGRLGTLSPSWVRAAGYGADPPRWP